MTEEIYKNGDIYYIKTLLGEINWTPTQDLGDKVIFYNQAYINEQIKRLEQENKQMKSALEEIREIVSDEIDKTDSDDELMQIYGTIYNRINEVLQ